VAWGSFSTECALDHSDESQDAQEGLQDGTELASQWAGPINLRLRAVGAAAPDDGLIAPLRRQVNKMPSMVTTPMGFPI
jgi:hypothetical protein